MSGPETIASYSFLPWLRQGLPNNIVAADGDSLVKVRASIPVELMLSGKKPNGADIVEQPIPKTVFLYGPGDITGIDSKAIIKCEPRNWITNFEPNYLPYAEFYQEDFPWRYTPASILSANRLRPWIALVVLKEDEFENVVHNKSNPLPSFKLREGKKAVDIFPKPGELWAWAHVHVNTDLTNEADPGTANHAAVTSGIRNINASNPDLAYSRIVCPRKLEANVSYFAFIIPSFESGRLAGLGQKINDNLPATESAWDNESKIEFPYYHRWYFRTGNVGDFEYLVNLLQPKLADKSVGVRDIDVLHPGSNLPPISDATLTGVLKLGGALRVPIDTLKDEDKAEALSYDTWDETPYPHTFTSAMAKRINLADDYKNQANNLNQVNSNAGIILEDGSGDPDPVIISPLYGQWQALQQRLLLDKDNINFPHSKNWIHELNLDPRFRTAAGLGTKVVQSGQEEYMQAAWQQVGDVVEANNKIRFAQVAKEVSSKLYSNHLVPLSADKRYVVTAPVQKRIMYKSLTVRAHVQESKVPVAVSSGVFRKIVRPRTGMMKNIFPNNEIKVFSIAARINDGKVIVAPPRLDPQGGINLHDMASEFKPKGLPAVVEKWLREIKGFKNAPLLLIALLALLIFVFLFSIIGFVFLAAASGLLLFIRKKLVEWDEEIKIFDAVSQESQIPEAVNSYPLSPDFVMTVPGTEYSPIKGEADSVQSIRFKKALKSSFEIVNASVTEVPKRKLEFNDIIDHTVKAIDPGITIPKRTFDTIKFPPHIRDNFKPAFAPVMVYPIIDLPMYKPLAGLSSELFLPNINKIEQNSITLLENNQKFIESYMVGINHEMSRELLWREYPTDQRGTYFRQFWDVNSVLTEQPVPEDVKDELRDIPPIDTWNKTNEGKKFPLQAYSVKVNELGSHNQRAEKSGKTQIVLVIRGELLKKYPTAVVYAQKAVWGTDESDTQTISAERTLIELTPEELKNPPKDKFQTPLFEAKVDPDIYFFGFDLDDEEVKGADPITGINDKAGWFFVLKERPGEPRFGLDINKAKTETGEERIINWNNLSWKDIGTPDGKYIELIQNPIGSNLNITFNAYDADTDQENKTNDDDVQAHWSDQTTSAELAYILYQVPVMVAVHGSRMLPKNENQ